MTLRPIHCFLITKEKKFVDSNWKTNRSKNQSSDIPLFSRARKVNCKYLLAIVAFVNLVLNPADSSKN